VSANLPEDMESFNASRKGSVQAVMDKRCVGKPLGRIYIHQKLPLSGLWVAWIVWLTTRLDQSGAEEASEGGVTHLRLGTDPPNSFTSLTPSGRISSLVHVHLTRDGA